MTRQSIRAHAVRLVGGPLDGTTSLLFGDDLAHTIRVHLAARAVPAEAARHATMLRDALYRSRLRDDATEPAGNGVAWLYDFVEIVPAEPELW